MSEFYIRVVVDPTDAARGGRKVRRELNQMEGAADRVGSAIRRALMFVGVSSAVHELTQIVDGYTKFGNRLKLITKNGEEAAAVTKELFDVANATRTSFEGSAELYARLGLATRQLGTEHRELLDVTRSINQALILSGVGGREATMGMIQLAQGISAGRLGGDELRSVLEQLPAVADVLGAHLRMNRAELKAFGAEGGITAEVVLRAFARAREELAEKFAGTIPTIAESFTVLRNKIVQFVGETSKATGAGEAISRMVLALANNLDIVFRGFQGLAFVIGVTFAQKAIRAAILGIRALNVAFASNPIGLVLVALTTLIALMISLRDTFRVSTTGVATFWDAILFGWQELKRYVSLVITALKMMWNEHLKPIATALLSLFSEKFGPVVKALTTLWNMFFKDIEFSFRGIATMNARIADATIAAWKTVADVIKKIWDLIPLAAAAKFLEMSNKVRSEINSMVHVVETMINAFLRVKGLSTIELPRLELKSDPFVKAGFDPVAEIRRVLADAFAKGLDNDQAIEKWVVDYFNRLEKFARERRAKQGGGIDLGSSRDEFGRDMFDALQFGQYLRQLEREAELLRMTSRERAIAQGVLKAEKKLKRELNEEERATLVERLRYHQSLADQGALLDKIKGPMEQYIASTNALKAIRPEISVEQFTQAMRNLRIEILSTTRTIASGLESGLLIVEDKFADTASVMENTIVQGFQEAEDALIQFVKTGVVDIRRFADVVVSELLRIALRAMVLQPLLNMFGGLFSFGGGASATAGIPFFNMGTGGPSIGGADYVGAGLPTFGKSAAAPPAAMGYGGVTINQKTSVTVEGGGRMDDMEADMLAKRVSDAVELQFQDSLRRAQRPGGQLNPMGAR